MPKRLKATERRASILAVAKILFADKGYHGVSVDEIASRLGVSPAILYRHFESKEALYEEVLNEIACRRESYVDAIVTGEADFASVLRRITRIYVDSVASDPDYLRMEMHSVLEGSAATRQFFENRWKPFSDYITVGLKDLIEEGHQITASAATASLMFQGILREALYAKCILKSSRYQEIGLHDLVEQLLGLFFRAIGINTEADSQHLYT